MKPIFIFRISFLTEVSESSSESPSGDFVTHARHSETAACIRTSKPSLAARISPRPGTCTRAHSVHMSHPILQSLILQKVLENPAVHMLFKDVQGFSGDQVSGTNGKQSIWTLEHLARPAPAAGCPGRSPDLP